MVSKNMSTRKTTVSNLIWRFFERSGAQLVNFVVQIVLARQLATDLFKTIAIVTVFTTLMQVFVDSGMGNALIQKKDADDLDFSTVFYFNMVVCVLLYIVMFFSAPFIADFYEKPELIPIIRVLSLTLIVSGVRNVQQAYVSRKLIFKKFFIVTLGGSLVSAVVGITMAYTGFGVWAIVAQQLVNVTVSTIILWFTVKWRPKPMFSFSRLKGLFSFGWKLLVSALIDTLYNDMRQLIIGKKYEGDELAFYNRGKQFPNLLITTINTSIDSVLLPTMSKAQDDPVRVKAMTRRSIRTSTYIMAPLMIGLAVCAETVIKVLLTDKWLPSAIFLRIFCITYLFYPIHTANLNAIKAMGKSGYFLVMEIIKKAVGVTLMLSTIFISVEAMAYSLLVSTLLSTIINAYPNKKLLNYSWAEQMKDILPNIGLAVLMGIPVYLIQFLPLPTILLLILQIIIGFAVYFGASKIFKFEILDFLLNTAKPFLDMIKTKLPVNGKK